jgi:hypothetical protein
MTSDPRDPRNDPSTEPSSQPPLPDSEEPAGEPSAEDQPSLEDELLAIDEPAPEPEPDAADDGIPLPPRQSLLAPRIGAAPAVRGRPTFSSNATFTPRMAPAVAGTQLSGGGDSLLRSPYVLAGLAIAASIVLAVFVVILSGTGGGSGAENEQPSVVDPLTPLPGRGVPSRSIATATVREGPAAEYLEVGLLRSGQDVEVVGRNTDSSWFQIFYPPGSQLRGWVPSSALRPPDTTNVPVVAVTPIPRPTVVLPTSTPDATETPAPTATVTGTPAPVAGPDLQARIVPGTCAVGQRLVLNVRNLGPGAITSRTITILVQTPNAIVRALVSPPPINLNVNQELDIDTTYVVQERVMAIVDPLGALGDVNVGNNRVDCVVAAVPPTPATGTTPGSGPTPTRTPTP